MENFIKLKKERKEEKKIIAEILRPKYIVNYLLNIFRKYIIWMINCKYISNK